MRTIVCLTAALAVVLGACAGRAPQPVSVVQPHDQVSDCLALTAEIEGNNQRIRALTDEQQGKMVQNVAAGVAGIFIWPIWFGMDLQGTAATEISALQSRQQYLGTLAQQRCAAQAPPPARRPPPRA